MGHVTIKTDSDWEGEHPIMNAIEIIELIKALPLKERMAVQKFLNEDLKEETEEKQTADKKTLRRLGEVFGRKPGT